MNEAKVIIHWIFNLGSNGSMPLAFEISLTISSCHHNLYGAGSNFCLKLISKVK
jgi:hypothetical protein